jgi:hypothetical protein
MENRHQRLEELRDVIRASRTALHSAPISNNFRGANPMVDTTRYLGVTLDKTLTWSPHIVQVRKRITQRMGLLVPLLNRRSELSIRN